MCFCSIWLPACRERQHFCTNDVLWFLYMRFPFFTWVELLLTPGMGNSNDSHLEAHPPNKAPWCRFFGHRNSVDVLHLRSQHTRMVVHTGMPVLPSSLMSTTQIKMTWRGQHISLSSPGALLGYFVDEYTCRGCAFYWWMHQPISERQLWKECLVCAFDSNYVRLRWTPSRICSQST